MSTRLRLEDVTFRTYLQRPEDGILGRFPRLGGIHAQTQEWNLTGVAECKKGLKSIEADSFHEWCDWACVNEIRLRGVGEKRWMVMRLRKWV